jgi:hypothetical protein
MLTDVPRRECEEDQREKCYADKCAQLGPGQTAKKANHAEFPKENMCRFRVQTRRGQAAALRAMAECVGIGHQREK